MTNKIKNFLELMKTKKILIITILVILIINITIVKFIINILPPGKIDFFFNEKQYTYIVNTLLTPEYNDVYGIQYNVIHFNNRNACGLEVSSYHFICSEPFYTFLKRMKLTWLYDIRIFDDKKVKIKISGSTLYSLSADYTYYIYKQTWFSQHEKTARNVIEVLNDNWLVAEWNISAPSSGQ